MSYKISNNCTGCTACQKICPVGAISGVKKGLHTVDPLLCIECGACGRICRFQAISDSNDNKCKPILRSSFPKPVFNLKECCGCTECMITCPASCLDIKLQKRKDGTLYPYIKNVKDCVACGFCAEVCPIGAIEMKIPKIESK